MTDLLRLSNSEMSTFRRCKRKWYLNTYRRLAPKKDPLPGTPLSIGNLVHSALEAYYNPEIRYHPVAYVENLIEDDVQAMPEYEIEIRKEAELCMIMLEGYLEWLAETGADAELEVQGTESKVEVNLIPGVNLISKLDAPVRRVSDGSLWALEHKTTGSLDQPLPLLKLDTQLLTEHLARFLHAIENGATADEAHAQCQGILYNMLRKVKRTPSAKPPFYGRVDVPHNIHELRNHWKHVVSIATSMLDTYARLDAGESHHTVCPPSPMKTCTWDCEFFKVCVMADDGSDFEGALDALYDERNPLERYEDAAEF
jgi:hypothetical protein